jgi:uncharacterized protein
VHKKVYRPRNSSNSWPSDLNILEAVLRQKLEALVALQKVDLDIAALRKSAEHYPKELAALEKSLADERSKVETEHLKLSDLERQRVALEETVSEDRDKVRKWEARLTEQRSTREYSALAREIDIAKKGQQTMSEEVAELIKQAGVQRETVKIRDAEVKEASQGLELRVQEVQKKFAEATAQIAGIDAKRQATSKTVDTELLRKYENVRRKRMPAMVAVAAPGTCGGCRMNVRPQLFNMLVASKGIDTCPSCSRIIFAAETLDGVKL